MAERDQNSQEEQQLLALLEENKGRGKQVKDFLLKIIEKLPEEVGVTLFQEGRGYTLEAGDLKYGSRTALLPDGIFRIPYAWDHRQGFLGESYNERQEIKPQEYLLFADGVLDRINYEIVCYKMQQGTTANTE